MRKSLVILMAVCMMMLTACAAPKAAETSSTSGEQQKIAVVANSATDDHCIQLVEGFPDGRRGPWGTRWISFFPTMMMQSSRSCSNSAYRNNYVGIYVTHGKADYSYDLLKPRRG